MGMVCSVLGVYNACLCAAHISVNDCEE